MLDFVHFPFAKKTISRKDAKAALDSRNDDQSPIDKLVSGHLDQNPAKSICTSNYYSEKERKHVADFLSRDIFFTSAVWPKRMKSVTDIPKIPILIA